MRTSRRDYAAADTGRQTALVIGGIGLLAIVLLGLVGWSFSSSSPTFTKALPTGVPGPTAAALLPAPAPTTYVVPTPTFVTPSVLPTGPRAPLLPPEVAAPEYPSAPTRPPAPPPSPTKVVPAPAQIAGVSLSCEAGRRAVKATLRLVSTGPVAVSVTAAGESRTETVTGRGNVSVVAQMDNPRAGTCSAVVAGRQLGPIRAQ